MVNMQVRLKELLEMEKTNDYIFLNAPSTDGKSLADLSFYVDRRIAFSTRATIQRYKSIFKSAGDSRSFDVKVEQHQCLVLIHLLFFVVMFMTGVVRDELKKKWWSRDPVCWSKDCK